jgi:phospholipid/cholesterol/gamma-HCH transport system substrate-binding protein
MAQRKTLAWTELRVGLLVIASFVLLIVAIFYIGGEAGFFIPKYTVTAYFPSANGLRTGAEVWLEGVTIGNVSTVRISTQGDPSRSVEAAMSLDQRFENIIRTDSTVNILTTGLLGDMHIEITRGTAAGQPIPAGGALQGVETGDIRQIITSTNDFVANLAVLSEQFRRMAERVDRGEGTIGKFLSDTSIYDNADVAVTEAATLVRDARTGTGTIGRLMSDDQLYQRISTTMDRVDTVVARIERGEGTAGKFINDPSLYNRADQLVARFQTVADRVDKGEGTLGKLINDDALYEEMRETIGKVSTLAASIESGQGTAGRLIKDPALYNSLNQTSSEILKLLYDFRQDPKRFLTINFRLF